MDPILGFWIGTLRKPTSWCQEVMYETLPAYCRTCHVQGHNEKTCKGKKKQSNSKVSQLRIYGLERMCNASRQTMLRTLRFWA